ncbi:uncharacterized protein LOC111089700 [Limulus polyphemus]|uniref:Uncharacterized protein LOC111089700 n=1 Tax=Limulus polyphemus TaxID=6850 RepID=A0ABM1TR42_LIMPO|nr:uncharacterized protein LOC111089700 [Limulus polyphemus]
MCERATYTMEKLTQEHHLTRNEAKQYQLWLTLLIVIGAVAAVSLLFNIILLCYNCDNFCRTRSPYFEKRENCFQKQRSRFSYDPHSNLEISSEEELVLMHGQGGGEQ